MELDLETKHQLKALLAKPHLVGPAHAPMLANLTKKFPFYQPLHLLLAKASSNEPNHQHLLAKASLYNNGSLLHRVIFDAENLTAVENINFITYGKSSSATSQSDEQETFEAIVDFEKLNVEIAEEIPAQIQKDALEIETFDNEVDNNETLDLEEKTEEEEPVFDEIEDLDYQVISAPEKEIETLTEKDVEDNFNQTFATLTADATYDIEIENLPINEIPEGQRPIASKQDIVDSSQSEPLTGVNERQKEDYAVESIASTDFFAFEKSFTTESSNHATEVSVAIPEEYNQEAEDEATVTKYDDDKLPYTFLWWLAKTRAEHEQVFQPYATAKKQTQPQPQPINGELQQQYVEHIFHLQTPFNEAEIGSSLQQEHIPTKSNAIIENFIKADPQLKPLKPDQIDNENKAKKSAEDHYDLVSETLASIYIEQTLYHKAIDTYQKLSLKFPEKSRYFADLIQSLEKKI
jgi:hypothetical protein